ncbi:MAG: RsmB/NOP family class I SAM-dependent RNA methyltransferase, partial [Pseudomonadota bacterium]
MTPGARYQAAIDLLEEIYHGAAPADEIVSHWGRRNRYAGGGDRRAIRALVFGVVRHRGQLRWWAEQSGLEPSARLDAIAALVLVQACTPEDLGSAFGGGRYAAPALSDEEQSFVLSLSSGALSDSTQPRPVRLNYPDWLDPLLATSFGDDLETELSAFAEQATLDLRVNVLKGDRDDARRSLADDGIEAAPTPWSPVGLRVATRVPLNTCKAWRDGLIEVQDEGSQIAAALVGARPGEAIVDLCAGAGGKTLALAAAMLNDGRIVACDVSSVRLGRGRERIMKVGVAIVEERPLSGDDDPWIANNAGAFDRVLLDTPCSGIGAWRRNPDARWRLSPSGLEAMQRQQDSLLDNAAMLVRPGGRITYVTCSVLRGENEDRIRAFLDRSLGFSVVPIGEAWVG